MSFRGGLPIRHLASLWSALSPTMRGILLMCISTVFFSGMHVLVRHVTRGIHPFEVAFFRNVFGFAIFLPMLLRSGLGFLHTRRIGLHALRGVLNVVAMLMFFSGLALSPVARVTALAFTAPLFMALLSVAVLGERFRLRRWVALVAGFAGTLVILRPGMIPIDAGSLLVVASASIWAVTMVVIKILSRTESSFVITAYMNIFLAVFSLLPAIWVWQAPSAEEWLWLVLIGLLGTFAQLALSQALKEAEPTAVMPFDFLKLVWATLLGWIVFGELPDFLTYLGAAVVFGSGLYIAWREQREQLRPSPSAAPNA